ncbi:hypothetical protein VPH35_040627 [Triticum aestivum]
MADAGYPDLPTDVPVEILLRLPPSSRRRFRLICRLWRDLIGERTTDMQSRATALLWIISEARKRYNNVCKFDTIQVLTLGKASWREMQTGTVGGGRCHLDAGIISIDGTTYWVTEEPAIRVVSFDLEHERITDFKRLPAHSTTPDQYNLTEVHGRLGIVFHNYSTTTEVWILDKGRRWSHRYSLRQQDLLRPHFVYGEHVLTLEGALICAHYRRKGMWSSNNPEPVMVSNRAQGTVVAEINSNEFCFRSVHHRIFPYVKTMEPLRPCSEVLQLQQIHNSSFMRQLPASGEELRAFGGCGQLLHRCMGCSILFCCFELCMRCWLVHTAAQEKVNRIEGVSIMLPITDA